MTGGYIEIIKKSTQVIEEVRNLKEPELECNELSTIYSWEGVIRDLDRIA